MDYQPGLKAILDNSAILVTWALAAVAGTIAALIGSSYERPKTWFGRLMYVLFPIAWSFLGWSIYEGQKISSGFIAAQLASDKGNVRKILIDINDEFAWQWLMLAVGLVVLLGWLLWFLGWLIFWAPKAPEKRTLPQRRLRRAPKPWIPRT
jgi:hypothetical protein